MNFGGPPTYDERRAAFRASLAIANAELRGYLTGLSEAGSLAASSPNDRSHMHPDLPRRLRRSRITFKKPLADGRNAVMVCESPSDLDRRLRDARNRKQGFVSVPLSADSRERAMVPIASIGLIESVVASTERWSPLIESA